MSRPFIDLIRANSKDAPPVIAVLAQGETIRTTGSHAHRRGQLLGALKGLISIGTETGRWVVPATNAVWIPPLHPHELLAHGPFKGWSIYVAEEACTILPNEPRVIRVSGLLSEAANRAASWTTDILDEQQMRIAAVILDEIAGAAIEKFGLPMPRDARLMRITRALMTDVTDRRRLEDWASWASVPSRTLSRRFVVETGFSFSEWRQRARLMHALEMLAADATVTTIAMDVGYDNVSAFISLFQKTFGVTPTRYFAINSAFTPK